MRANFLLAALGASCVASHSIMQKISVNGVDQGQLKGVRAPGSDGPIQNVNDAQFACNKDIMYKDKTIIPVPAGAKVGAWWGHVIGGAQFPGDPDTPIHDSHMGPIMYYLAKVDNAATAGTTGLKWFKVAEDGLKDGKWAVNRLRDQKGWHYFTFPTCIAPGDYLLRVELIALHSAGQKGEAQFYMECAQIRVTGSGTSQGGNYVSFPGAYSATDPGILVNIYDNRGQNNGGGRPYKIPGPAVYTCGADSGPKPTTLATVTKQATTAAPVTTTKPGYTAPVTTAKPQPTTASSGGGSPLYGQCGGNGYTGPKTCAQGSCKSFGEWYSQCIN